MITKEFYIKATEDFKVKRSLTQELMECIHSYYLDINTAKFSSRNRLTNFNDFVEHFNLYHSMPVSTTIAGIPNMVKYENMDITLGRVKNYFNKLFNIAN